MTQCAPPPAVLPCDDLSDAATASSPSSSISSVDDAVNSSSARVYFGPLQTPEMKFTFTATRQCGRLSPPPVSPLRRSPRLSRAVEDASRTAAGTGPSTLETQCVPISEETTPLNDLFLQDGELLNACAL